MNRVIKAIAFATIVFSYNAVQTSRTKKTVNRAYDMGVEDGLRLIDEVIR